MAKELTHRADELKALGWSNYDTLRYAELWDYRQRWGAMNLEREDRLFLKKAESALPKIVSGKVSVKKPLKEKSYYKWLSFYLKTMKEAEKENSLKADSRGAWPILLEEELRGLDYYEPVLGLPDTLKAKAFIQFRENIIKESLIENNANIELMRFDFVSPLDDINKSNASSWKHLREGVADQNNIYPVLTSKQVELFREKVREKIIPLIRETLPSLSASEKPHPPKDWSPQ